MLKGSIDLGTNSLRYIIANFTDDNFEIIKEQGFLCRIGEGLEESGDLQLQPMERTLKFLSTIKSAFDKYKVKKYRFVATEALRKATNSDLFLNKVETIGLKMEIIDGIEEAKIISKAVKYFMPNEFKNSLFIDQGGGSVEFIHHLNGNETYKSLPIGVVRLKEKFVTSYPISLEKLKEIQGFIISEVKNSLDYVFSHNLNLGILIGGTAATLAKIHLKLPIFDKERIHKTAMTYEEINTIFQKLLTQTPEEISREHNVDSKRADIFPVGVLQILTIMETFQLEKVQVCECGLRYGLLL